MNVLTDKFTKGEIRGQLGGWGRIKLWVAEGAITRPASFRYNANFLAELSRNKLRSRKYRLTICKLP